VGYSPEDMLLITCAKIDMDDMSRKRLESILDSNLDWDYLVEKAALHRITPLLYVNLIKNDTESIVPQSVIEKLKITYHAKAVRNMLLFRELSVILKKLQNAAIEVIVLKGPILAEIVYKNITLRPFNDIDLLVKKDNLPYIEQELGRLAYSNQKTYLTDWHAQWDIKLKGAEELHYINRKNNILIDLHWDIQPPSSRFQIDINQFWENAQSVKIAGAETLMLAPENLLEHLCLHLNKEILNAPSVLLWCCDIAEVVSNYKDDIDWERLVKSCKHHGIEIPVHQALAFACNFLNAPVPVNVLIQLESRGKIHIISLGQILHSEPVPKQEKYKQSMRDVARQISSIKGNRQKIRFVLGYPFPSKAFLQHRYSFRGFYLFYFWRLTRPILFVLLLARYLPHFRQFSLRKSKVKSEAPCKK
jgi:hypothetical protein